MWWRKSRGIQSKSGYTHSETAVTFDCQEKLGFLPTVLLLMLLVGFVSLLATRKRAEDEQADEAGESEE